MSQSTTLSKEQIAKQKKYDESLKDLQKQMNSEMEKYNKTLLDYQKKLDESKKTLDTTPDGPKKVAQQKIYDDLLKTKPNEVTFIMSPELMEKFADHVFLEFDKDKNEGLDREEAQEAFQKTLSIIGKPSMYNYYVFEKIFQEADQDKNGLLSKKEVKDYFKKYSKEFTQYVLLQQDQANNMIVPMMFVGGGVTVGVGALLCNIF